MQCRDYAAAIYAGDDDAWARMQLLNSHAYMVLQLFGVRDYGNAILLNKMQIHYLETINHPVMTALKRDPTIANEEKGEISLSRLAAAMVSQNEKSSIDTLHRIYRLSTAHTSVTHASLAALGISQDARTHSVVHIHRAKEVSKIASWLHMMCSELRNDELQCFVLDGQDARIVSDNDSASDNDEVGGNDDEGAEADTTTQADAQPLVTKMRIDKAAQLEDAEPTVWLTEGISEELRIATQIAKVSERVKNNIHNPFLMVNLPTP